MDQKYAPLIDTHRGIFQTLSEESEDLPQLAFFGTLRILVARRQGPSIAVITNPLKGALLYRAAQELSRIAPIQVRQVERCFRSATRMRSPSSCVR